jgi:L-alanine-DL-glutamate epimerase-like enolase superfamily enzyme
MESNVARSEAAKGLLDMACYDLAGRTAGLSVCELIGGACAREIPLCALVPLMDPASMLGIGRMVFEGYRSFRLKLGTGIEMTWKGYSPSARPSAPAYGCASTTTRPIRRRLRCAQSRHRTVRNRFRRTAVAASDFAGMAYVQRLVDTPLMAHESCFSLRDFIALADLGPYGCSA